MGVSVKYSVILNFSSNFYDFSIFFCPVLKNLPFLWIMPFCISNNSISLFLLISLKSTCSDIINNLTTAVHLNLPNTFLPTSSGTYFVSLCLRNANWNHIWQNTVFHLQSKRFFCLLTGKLHLVWLLNLQYLIFFYLNWL